MEDPKSKARIVEELIKSHEGRRKNMYIGAEQGKVELKTCYTFLQFFYYGPQSKDN